MPKRERKPNAEAARWVRNTETRKAHLRADGDEQTKCGLSIPPLGPAHSRGWVQEHSPPKRDRRCKSCLAADQSSG